jgi:hypothetical protein
MCRRIFIILYIVISPLILLAHKADDPLNPCVDGGVPDPLDNNCPLDTWVIILAFFAVVFAAIYLQRKQKTLKPAAKGF